MYNTQVTTQEEALSHLFFHCCLKDGRFDASEIDKISELFVQFGLQANLNFKDEVRKYRAYAIAIENEQEFINFLAALIMPVNVLALFSWCVELMLIDETLSTEEEALLTKIADAFDITKEENTTIHKLMIQRRIVLTDKIF